MYYVRDVKANKRRISTEGVGCDIAANERMLRPIERRKNE